MVAPLAFGDRPGLALIGTGVLESPVPVGRETFVLICFHAFSASCVSITFSRMYMYIYHKGSQTMPLCRLQKRE